MTRFPFHLLLCVLTLCGCNPVSADFSIDSSADFQGITNARVKEILVPVEMLLRKRFGSAPSHPVEVYERNDNPRVDLIGGVQRIGISARKHFYMKYAYQFAHEYGHVLTNWQDKRNARYLWFEETLAELASLYVIQSFAENQQYRFTEAQWIRYLEDIKEKYTAARLKKHGIVPMEDAHCWFLRLAPMMEENPLTRELNGGIAAELLPHFIERPELWRALAFLNQWDTSKNQDFRDYLGSWIDTLGKSGESVEAVQVISNLLYGEGSATGSS